MKKIPTMVHIELHLPDGDVPPLDKLSKAALQGGPLGKRSRLSIVLRQLAASNYKD